MSRILYVSPNELRRLSPFFGIYALIFSGLTLADGLALSLFLQRVGAEALPRYYALTAIVTLVLIICYLKVVSRWSSIRLFQWILIAGVLPFAIAFLVGVDEAKHEIVYGAFFVAKEISLIMILMHFGTVLQTYFTRPELNRVLPLVYSGGRFGGLVGAALLAFLAKTLGLSVLFVCYIVITVLAVGVLTIISKRISPIRESEEAAVQPTLLSDSLAPKEGLWRLFATSPLLTWLTLTGFLFTICRWLLNYQYSVVFESSFGGEQALASFIGRYTFFATMMAMLIQFLLASRLIASLGLSGVHKFYNGFLVLGFIGQIIVPGISAAVFARFVETELRFALRNPVNQLMTNLFSKRLRITSRAITIGAINPFAAIVASSLILARQSYGWHDYDALIVILAVAVYLWFSQQLYRSIRLTPAEH